ncbi:MAG: aminotransferase class V-fold PLP-dependent enzyme [Proteobacteria bacterium]|nr:aminotransferase class V-fold PLP-dependent enzyme [Pseudomonadota bacterium]
MIYLDHNATMPATSSHLQQVTSQLEQCDANPSNTHVAGRRAKKHLEDARNSVASLLGCAREQIFFTSGATEGNYTVVYHAGQKSLELAKNSQIRPQFMISQGEHSSHENVCHRLCESHGFSMLKIPLLADGRVNQEILQQSISEDTLYFGLNDTNHESGIINQVAEITAKVRILQPNCHIHVDAAQAFGKRHLDYITTNQIDSLVFSAHKIGGLKGIGGLYLKDPYSFKPLLGGGGSQERGLRAGTENLLGIISLGKRASDIQQNSHWLANTKSLYDSMLKHMEHMPGIKIFGNQRYSSRLACSFTIEDQKAERVDMIWNRHQIAIGRGSACSMVSYPSKTLLSMGASQFEAMNSFRISLGPENTASDIDYFLHVLKSEVLSVSP